MTQGMQTPGHTTHAVDGPMPLEVQMYAQKWLFRAAIFTEVSGILMVLGALLPGTLDPLVSLLFAEPVTLDAAARLGAGIAGAAMSGWASMLAVLVRSVDALSAHILGTATAVGVGTWFVLDGIVSIATGAAANLAGNFLYLVILLLPALAVRDRRGRRQTA